MTGPVTPSPFDVAVIIPTHNRRDLAPLTVRSAVEQDFEGRWEVVVVDDGSTDDTAEVIGAMAKQHGDGRSRVVVRYLHQANAGQSVARNLGLANTTAPLVCFLDDDDLCDPRKLRRQVRAFDDPRVGLCHTSFRYIDKHGTFTDDGPQRTDNPCQGDCVPALLEEYLIITSTIMARRSVLERIKPDADGRVFDPRWVRAQDYDMVLRVARHAALAYLPEPLLGYRLHGGNVAMSPANIARSYRYHSLVQIDFAERFGRAYGLTRDDALRNVRQFLLGRAESFFWQRQLESARSVCELAKELGVGDDAFAQIAAKASRPAWVYRIKDALDRARGRASAGVNHP